MIERLGEEASSEETPRAIREKQAMDRTRRRMINLSEEKAGIVV
jgi:hypothetical protein